MWLDWEVITPPLKFWLGCNDKNAFIHMIMHLHGVNLTFFKSRHLPNIPPPPSLPPCQINLNDK